MKPCRSSVAIIIRPTIFTHIAKRYASYRNPAPESSPNSRTTLAKLFIDSHNGERACRTWPPVSSQDLLSKHPSVLLLADNFADQLVFGVELLLPVSEVVHFHLVQPLCALHAVLRVGRQQCECTSAFMPGEGVYACGPIKSRTCSQIVD